MYFLTSVIMDVVVDLYGDLRRSLQTHYPEADWEDLPLLLQYASWIGGDRDGNPNVTPEVTLQTGSRHERGGVYLDELNFLADHLTAISR